MELNNKEKKAKNKSKRNSPNMIKNLITLLKTWVNVEKSYENPLISTLWEKFKHNERTNKNIFFAIYANPEVTEKKQGIFLSSLGIDDQGISLSQYL